MSASRTFSGIRLSLLVFILLIKIRAWADDQEVFHDTSTITALKASQLTPGCKSAAPPDLTTAEPYQTGYISVADAKSIIDCLDGAKVDSRVSIIHILRWSDSAHSAVKFQKWYVYDPSPPTGNFYLSSAQSRFDNATILGRTSFRLIYIHINFDPNNNHGESFTTIGASGQDILTHPVTYSVTIKKAQTQFVKDLISLLSILGAYTPQAISASAADPEVGYFSVYEFKSAFKTSTVTITASENSKGGGGGGGGAATSNQLGTQTYTNEGPSWIGLSFAVPLTSYKTLTYSQTNGSITTSQVNQQNIYAAVDFYYPRAVPTWTSLRYIPHPFFGMPIKKQPLRNTALGIAMGWHWLEPFGGVVFDVGQVNVANGTLTNHTVIKGIWGLKISVSDVAKALKNSASSSSSKSASTKSSN